MAEESRSKMILEVLCRNPYILNIKWSKNYQVFIDATEEPPEEAKRYIKNLLLQMCDKYEIIFQVRKKKKWWQTFLEKLKWQRK